MKQALSEHELYWLASALDQLQTDYDEGMSLSMADGFFTALALSPQMILPSQWLAWVLPAQREVGDLQQEQHLLSLLMRHYNRVQFVIRQSNPPEFEPVLLYRDEHEQPWVAQWCHGFISGVSLAQTAWQEAMPQAQETMTLEIIAGMSTLLPPDVDPSYDAQFNVDHDDLQDEQMAQHMRAVAQEALETYQQQLDPSAQWETLLETCVMQLRDYMLHPHTTDTLCPCGSGQLFIDCCGRQDRQLH